MKLLLSGFDSIDYYFEEWIKNPPVMTVLVIGDVQTYLETLTEKEFTELKEQAVLKRIPDLLHEFKKINKNDTKQLKNVYLGFIKNLIKDFKTASVKDENIEDFMGDNKHDLAEDEIIMDNKKKTLASFSEENPVLMENTINQFDELVNKIPLSTLERSALKYLRDRKQKDVILENFTLKGIMQLANRAVYKIFFYKNLTIN